MGRRATTNVEELALIAKTTPLGSAEQSALAATRLAGRHTVSVEINRSKVDEGRRQDLSQEL